MGSASMRCVVTCLRSSKERALMQCGYSQCYAWYMLAETRRQHEWQRGGTQSRLRFLEGGGGVTLIDDKCHHSVMETAGNTQKRADVPLDISKHDRSGQGRFEVMDEVVRDATMSLDVTDRLMGKHPFKGACTPANANYETIFKDGRREGEQRSCQSTSGLWALKLASARHPYPCQCT